MESIEVTARFSREGEIIPVSIVLNGQILAVEAVGRSWENGSSQHFLVMVPVERVYEIVFMLDETRWYLKRTGKRSI